MAPERPTPPSPAADIMEIGGQGSGSHTGRMWLTVAIVAILAGAGWFLANRSPRTTTSLKPPILSASAITPTLSALPGYSFGNTSHAFHLGVGITPPGTALQNVRASVGALDGASSVAAYLVPLALASSYNNDMPPPADIVHSIEPRTSVGLIITGTINCADKATAHPSLTVEISYQTATNSRKTTVVVAGLPEINDMTLSATLRGTCVQLARG